MYRVQTMAAVLDALPRQFLIRESCRRILYSLILQFRDYRQFWLALEDRWQRLIVSAMIPWVAPDPTLCPLYFMRFGLEQMDRMDLPVLDDPRAGGLIEVTRSL